MFPHKQVDHREPISPTTFRRHLEIPQTIHFPPNHHPTTQHCIPSQQRSEKRDFQHQGSFIPIKCPRRTDSSRISPIAHSGTSSGISHVSNTVNSASNIKLNHANVMESHLSYIKELETNHEELLATQRYNIISCKHNTDEMEAELDRANNSLHSISGRIDDFLLTH